jgi:hypothetical protein
MGLQHGCRLAVLHRIPELDFHLLIVVGASDVRGAGVA